MGEIMTAPAVTALAAKDFKSDYKPIWCPGCGDYSVLSSVTKALATLGLRPENVAVVSGIGCSSRIPAYTTCYGFHGVHGRSLAAATGLKVARPDLTVLVASGDGDGYSIGGNHFLHACRRNVDLTYIVMDNHVYGMTKGQPSPTTEPGWSSKLAQVEALHAKRILEEMGWPSMPALPVAYAWESSEAPETAAFDELHYLMHPWHALEIALRCELQAQQYFEGIAASKVPRRVRTTALEMAEEEREHVQLIRDWMKKVPKPPARWADDPDPPQLGE